MATEELIVRAVRAGGDRQEAHERIRQHSIEAARAMKDGATRNDMLERLAGDRGVRRARSATCESALDPTRFVGRAPQQVDEFLDEVVDPLLAGAPRCDDRARGGARMTHRAARRRSRCSIFGAARCATSTSSTTIACCSWRPIASARSTS